MSSPVSSAAAPRFDRASSHLGARIRATRILLIGATGNNGGEILRALDELGARPRLLVRSLEQARERWPGERDWVVGDLRVRKPWSRRYAASTM